jgi:hypothetical protein
MLSHVSILCFAASYTVALLSELSRLLFRAPLRQLITSGFTAAGLFAHTVYLIMRASPGPGAEPRLSSWFDWLLWIAWGVAVVYLALAVRRPQATLGIFMLPLVLVLIAVATRFRGLEQFNRSEALYIWGIMHGMALLLGTVVVLLGFAAGAMYLVQSYRLKRKLLPRPGFKLPSLEWLQRANKRALILSSCLLAAGLLAGTVLNLVKGEGGMPWTDPVVGTSGILFLWLVVVLLFEWLYRPAQQGRKVAYLTLASFVFLGLVLGIVLLSPSQHALTPREAPADSRPSRGAGSALLYGRPGTLARHETARSGRPTSELAHNSGVGSLGGRR